MSEGSSRGYGFLAQRAYEFLKAQHGPVDEDMLIRHVFSALPGQNPAKMNVEIWRGVLPSVLADTTRFQPLGGRTWTIAREGSGAAAAVADELASMEYIVLDTETTGLEAARHRIIEVAALHYLPDCTDSTPSDSYISVVNPARRLPSFIVSHTGITQAMVNAAPPFAAVVDDVRGFIAERVIVGHNISFDIAFLNAEMRRLGLPLFLNPRLDTLAMAVKLMDNLSKPNLTRVAMLLGLPVGVRHRAEADARLTRQVFCRLLAIARERGIHTRAALLEVGRPLGAEYWQRRKRRGSRFDPQAWQWPADPLVQITEVDVVGNDWLENVPEAAGVYVMRDTNGNALYVGKANNLRRRVANYYSRDEGVLRGLVGLREATARLELREVGSELAAELLELSLIGELQPGYNTQKTASAPRFYIRLHQPKRGQPGFKPAAVPSDDCFGPFATSTEVSDTLRLLRDIFPALGKGKVTLDEFQQQLAEATAFLRGDDEPTLARLRDRLHDATAIRDYEAERQVRHAIAEVLKRRERSESEPERREISEAILILPTTSDEAREVFIVRGGELRWHGPLPATAVDDVLAARLAELWLLAGRTPTPDPSAEMEEGNGTARASAEMGEGNSGEQLALLPEAPPRKSRRDEATSLVLRWLYAHPTHAGLLLMPSEREAMQDALRQATRMIKTVLSAEC